MDKKERLHNYRYFMGLNAWEIGCNKEGVRPIVVNDGPLGLRKPAINDFEQQGNVLETVCLLSPSALAASFSKDVCYQNGSLLALDCLSKEVDVLLAPGINIKRSALCGRNFEYFSEDPFLAGYLSSQYILGLEENGGAACVKHYALNNQEPYRLTNSSEVSLRAINEIYLWPFAYVIKHASPSLLMTSYNRVNGEYVNESEYLMKKKLRGEYNYHGLVVSDWTAVMHKGKTIHCGLDVEMPVSKRTPEYVDQEYGVTFNDDDIIKRKEEIIENVERLANKVKPIIKYDFAAIHEKAISLAEETFVLLKNDDHYLPFAKDKKTLVIGYFASHPRFVGGGSAWVNTHQSISYLMALDKMNIPYDYLDGYEMNNYLLDENKTKEIINKYDQVLTFVGQYENDESEGWDRGGISLHLEQKKLLDFLHLNKVKYASVVITGSVIDISLLKHNSSAIIVGYLAGEGMYEALRNVIYGDKCPSGRLPETWISSLEANPIYHDLLKTPIYYSYYDDDIFVGYRYYDKKENQQLVNYEFGEGLSYADFTYQDFKVNSNNRDISISLSISNISSMASYDVIQVYIGKKDSAIYRPFKELKGIEKVLIASHETKTIALTIDHDLLASYRLASDKLEVEKGIYQVYIAKNTHDILYTNEVYIDGIIFEENKEIPILKRHDDPKEVSLLTPIEVVLHDEKFNNLIHERKPNIDVVDFFNKHSWMLKEPIKNITFNGELDIDFYLLEKYYRN